MKRIRVAHLAERDLDWIWYRIAQKSASIEIANGVVDSITAVFGMLANAPRREHGEMTSIPELEAFQSVAISFTTAKVTSTS